MTEATTLDRFELERFLFIIEFSLKITQRHQFFTWAQGVLQGLLPHGLLVCAVGDLIKHSFRIDHFTSEPLPDEDLATICGVDDGVLSRIMRQWEKNARRPILIDATRDDARGDPKLAEGIARLHLSNAVAHGSPGVSGAPSSFFCFFRVAGPPSDRHAYLIELLTPYLHAAWARTETVVDTKPRSIPFPETILTVREREILQWIHDGKSNGEIGTILNLSPLTVKNHVQKLLRKLNVPNRAQAVAKGLALTIIKTE